MTENPLKGLIGGSTYRKLDLAKVLSETRVRDYGVKLTFLELKRRHGSNKAIGILAETIHRSEDRVRSVIYKEKPTAKDLARMLEKMKAADQGESAMLWLPFMEHL